MPTKPTPNPSRISLAWPPSSCRYVAGIAAASVFHTSVGPPAAARAANGTPTDTTIMIAACTVSVTDTAQNPPTSE